MLNLLISRAPAFSLGLLFMLFAVVPMPTLAGGIDDAFDNLLSSASNVSYTKPGNYSSQARNTFVAGGLDVRFPSSRAPALYSVTPFNFNAGCSGVSMHFGGLSFISGDEIKRLIESVAQNSEGVAIELVMTTLCGPCAHVMQVMRSLATAAARTALDSCQVARNLTEAGAMKFFGYDKHRADKQSVECSQLCTEENTCSEWVASLTSGLCSGAENMATFLEDTVVGKLDDLGIEDEQTKAEVLCKVGVKCNTLWTAMNSSNDLRGEDPDKVRAKVLIMNVMGTNVTCGTDVECKQNVVGDGVTVGDGGVTVNANGVYTFPPQLGNVAGEGDGVSMQDVFALFMCGTNWETAGKSDLAKAVIRQFCEVPGGADSPQAKAQAQLAQMPVWDCVEKTYCLSIKKVPASESSLQGEGYLPKVVDLIYDAVMRVRRNEALTDEQISLIQVIPSVPLYQAINAAAVYPDAGGNLVSLMSTYTAQLLAYAHIRDIIRQAERLDKSNALSDEAYDRIYAFLGGMRATTHKAMAQISQSMVMQQALMEQIRMINLAMQREVMSSELLGTARYSMAVTEAAGEAAGTN